MQSRAAFAQHWECKDSALLNTSLWGLYFLRTGVAEFFKKSRFFLMPNLEPSSLGGSHPLCELEGSEPQH